MVALPAPNIFAAARHPSIDFLEHFFAYAPWPLVAIREGSPVVAITLTQAERRAAAAEEWITRHNQNRYSIYFAPNPLRSALARKATKADVAAAAWLWVDVDPPKTLTGAELDAWRYDRRMEFEGPLAGLPEPTLLIDSGRGFWIFWRLRSPAPVGDKGELTSKIEAHGRAIERAFAPWADHCSNIDRIARLPGTVNHKTGIVASVITISDVDYELADFPAPIAVPVPAPPQTVTAAAAADVSAGLSDLPTWLRDRIETEDVPHGARSEHFHSVVTSLAELNWSHDVIERAIAGRSWATGKYGKHLRREIERCAGKTSGSRTVTPVESEAFAGMAGKSAALPAASPMAKPYPMDALGDVLGPAARAIADKVQCAEALAAQSVLGVGSLAAQGIADVRLPYGQTRPLSLFFLASAHSGERKTSADNEAEMPVRMHERQLREAYEPLRRSYDVALAAWRAQKAQVDRGKSNLDARAFELEALGPEPTPPIKPVHTINELTVEGLAKNWPHLPGALGVFSAEAGQFLGGHGFNDEAKLRTAAALCQLWDGAPLRRLRAGDGLIDLHGRRLACHLMIQPEAGLRVLADPVFARPGAFVPHTVRSA